MRLQLRSNAVNIGLTGTCGVLAFCFSKAESSQVGLSETEPPGHHPCDRSCRAPPPRPAYRSEERQQRLPCACSPRFSPPTGLLGILGGTLLSFLSSTWDDAPSTPQIHTQTLEHTCFLCPQMTSCLDLNVTRGGKLPGPPASQGRAACSVFLAVITPLLTSLCMTSWRISFISLRVGPSVSCPLPSQHLALTQPGGGVLCSSVEDRLCRQRACTGSLPNLISVFVTVPDCRVVPSSAYMAAGGHAGLAGAALICTHADHRVMHDLTLTSAPLHIPTPHQFNTSYV